MVYVKDRYFKEMMQLIREDILYDGETYETIPVISWYSTINKEMKGCDGISRSRVLLSLAMSFINIARELCNDQMFFAIGIRMDDFNEDGYFVPDIIVSNNAEYIGYFTRLNHLELKNKPIREIIESTIGISDFSIHGDSDTDGEITLIPKAYANRSW